jgi:HlyD family secretion protein
MDRPREKRKRGIHYCLAGGGALAIPVLSLSLVRLGPTGPEIQRQSVVFGTVIHGPMLFEVRGPGTLIPEKVEILSAQVACRVDQIRVYPGAWVRPDTVIAELSSPELEQSARDAHWQLRSAEADYKVNHLNQQAAVQAAQAAAKEARAALAAMVHLRNEGLIAELEVLKAEAKAEEVNGRLNLEQARLRLFENKDGQAAPSLARLEQARALSQLKERQLGSLHLRPGIEGVLQYLPLQPGQSVGAGQILARIAKPLPLKAELKIPETQAKDVQIGQPVTIDTRNGLVKGRLIRVDPSVQNGTVLVEATLDANLPKGARPDLSVDGVIELARSPGTLQVARPVQAQPHAMSSVFKLSADGTTAQRVKVRFGRGSVSQLEVLEGLRAGDQIILSDTSPWDDQDHLRLK